MLNEYYYGIQKSDYQNFLYHKKKFKYIKKVKKNGKWRYYYDYKITGKGYKEDGDKLYREAKNMLSKALSRWQKDPSNEKLMDEYYKTLDKYKELEREAIELKNKSYDAIIPKTQDKIQDAIWDMEITIKDLPHDIVDKGRMVAATILAGKASDYLVNDILSKTDTKEVISGDWVYRYSDNGLTRMSKREARDRQRYGDLFYEEYLKE